MEKDTKQSELEKEFNDLCVTAGKQIKDTIEEIQKLYRECQSKVDGLKKEIIAIADQNGIPFAIEGKFSEYSSHESGMYLPESYFEKFSSLDQAFVAKTANIDLYYELDEDYIGWSSSSC